MPKFIQEFLDNLDFDFDFEIPDFPSGSDCRRQQSPQAAEEEFLFPDDLETL